jgi:polygalacturonase
MLHKSRKLIFAMLMVIHPLTVYPGNRIFYNVTSYGARNDGRTPATRAVQSAIDDCSKSGGGTVWFPAGRYVSGTIYLKSNVSLFLDAGAVIEGSKNIGDYPVTISKIRSYTDNYTCRSLIYAEDLENIAITGQGTIDGNGAFFKVENMVNDESIRKKDEYAFYKNRPYLVRVINCRKVLVRDVRLINSPMWVQHYLSCEDVNIDGITVNSRVNHNNDGIDIDGCSNVRISDCNIISGDDAIVLKSTFDRSCSNITVTNCVMSSNCNAFKLGTETNGGFQNVTLSNCTIYDTHLAGITLQMVDGGLLDRVTISDVVMDRVGTAIFIRLGNRARPFMNGTKKPGMGQMRNIMINDIQADNVGQTGCAISGLPGYPAENISLTNISLNFEGGVEVPDDFAVPENPDAYPEHNMFGTLPAYGFYCRHCRDVDFQNVTVGYKSPDKRSAIVCDDVENLVLNAFSAETEGVAPLIVFRGVSNGSVRLCDAPEGTGTFLLLTGEPCSHISISGNDLSRAKKAFVSENHSPVYVECNRAPLKEGISEGRYVNCDVTYTDDRNIRVRTQEDVKRKRTEIIKAIWGTDHLPDRSDAVVTTDVISPLSDGSLADRVDRYEIPVSAIPGSSETLMDLAYLFRPGKRDNRLIILNPGHSCTLREQPRNDPRIEATINGLLRAGYDVLAVFMPHVTQKGCDLDHCKVINTDTGPGDHPATYGLRFFLEPEIVCLNHILNTVSYADVNMVGLSGGGWTTNLLAAIDERISYSFNVAGSIPLYYRSGGSIGDIEQYLPELYRNIAGYPDLYVLGAFGKGRKQVQVLNRYDDCCFGINQHDPDRSYDADVRTFEKSVKDRLKQLESGNQYYLVVDDTAPNHQISAYALNNIILKELNCK